MLQRGPLSFPCGAFLLSFSKMSSSRWEFSWRGVQRRERAPVVWSQQLLQASRKRDFAVGGLKGSFLPSEPHL